MEYEHSQQMAGEFYHTQCEHRRPFYLIRAEMHQRGENFFEAKYGGVSGVGKTPEMAAIAFDLVWFNGSVSKAAEAEAKKNDKPNGDVAGGRQASGVPLKPNEGSTPSVPAIE